MIVCLICKNNFTVKRFVGQKYCSDTCKKAAKLEIEKIRKRKVRKQAGCYTTGREYPCKVCGTKFIFLGGRQTTCMSDECTKILASEKARKYRENNREKYLARMKEHEKRRRQTTARKEWFKVYSREVIVPKRRNSAKMTLDHRMSNQIRSALKTKKAGRSWKNILGYTVDELYNSIETKFEDGMSWSNISEWHIDHKIPKSSFNYEKETDPDFKICWSLENLQPLWAEENLRKSNKLDYKPLFKKENLPCSP